MSEPDIAESTKLSRWDKAWWGIAVCVFVLMFASFQFDTTTELTPDHTGQSMMVGVVFAIAFGLWGAVAGWRNPNQPGTINRIMAAFGLFIAGTIFVALASLGGGKLAWNAIDFPSGKTREYDNVLLMVSRAYHTHGKSQHNVIQTMPIWTNLNVSNADYAFMLAHRRADDHGTDRDEIASKGWFCAKVKVQQSGDALRVMHAGSLDLPEGSVALCPTDADDRARILDFRNGNLTARVQVINATKPSRAQ